MWAVAGEGGAAVEVTGHIGAAGAGRPVALEAADASGRVIMVQTVNASGPGYPAGMFVAGFGIPPDAHGTITITASAATPYGPVSYSATAQSPWPGPEGAAREDGAPSGGPPVAGAAAQDRPGGGCAVAAAAYGTDLARHAQALRELRDSAPPAAAAAVHALHAAYYSASPHAADLIREHPALSAAAGAYLRPPLEALSALAGAAAPRAG